MYVKEFKRFTERKSEENESIKKKKVSCCNSAGQEHQTPPVVGESFESSQEKYMHRELASKNYK